LVLSSDEVEAATTAAATDDWRWRRMRDVLLRGLEWQNLGMGNTTAKKAINLHQRRADAGCSVE
jgi:hypothetical protein